MLDYVSYLVSDTPIGQPPKLFDVDNESTWGIMRDALHGPSWRIQRPQRPVYVVQGGAPEGFGIFATFGGRGSEGTLVNMLL